MEFEGLVIGRQERLRRPKPSIRHVLSCCAPAPPRLPSARPPRPPIARPHGPVHQQHQQQPPCGAPPCAVPRGSTPPGWVCGAPGVSWVRSEGPGRRPRLRFCPAHPYDCRAPPRAPGPPWRPWRPQVRVCRLVGPPRRPGGAQEAWVWPRRPQPAAALPLPQAPRQQRARPHTGPRPRRWRAAGWTPGCWPAASAAPRRRWQTSRWRCPAWARASPRERWPSSSSSRVSANRLLRQHAGGLLQRAGELRAGWASWAGSAALGRLESRRRAGRRLRPCAGGPSRARLHNVSPTVHGHARCHALSSAGDVVMEDDVIAQLETDKVRL